MLTFLTLGLVVAALYVAREVFVPFALAVLLSFLLAPAVRWLRRMRVGRVTAVALIVAAAFLAVLGFAGIIAEEISLLGPQLPQYRYNIEAKLRAIPQAIPLNRMTALLHQFRVELNQSQTAKSTLPGQSTPSSSAAIEPAKPLPVEIQQPEPTPLEIAGTVLGPLLSPLATAGLVLVLVIFILLEREELRDRLLRLAGGGDLHRTTEAMNEAAHRVSRYLASQLAVNLCCGIPIGIGLAVIGIPNAALWGMLGVLLRFIPYFGIVIAACFPLALALAVAPGWSLLVWTGLLFAATELIVANFIEPRLYGGRTGLSSVAVIAAAIFWTWLWGPIGLLLSTPLTVCLLVLGRNVPQLHFLDVLLGSEPVLTPEETFYQRLLANDPEEATEQAEEFAKQKSLDAFFEEVAIPVLVRAQDDSDADILPAARRATLKDGFARIIENLFDDSVSDDEAAAEGDVVRKTGPRIVCMAGRNEIDEAAAMILAGQVRARGHSVEIVAADANAATGVRPAVFRDAAIVCLCLISTSSPARARHIIRRMRRRTPRARLVLCLWGHLGEVSSHDARAISTADWVATSPTEALAEIDASLAAAPSLIAAGAGAQTSA